MVADVVSVVAPAVPGSCCLVERRTGSRVGRQPRRHRGKTFCFGCKAGRLAQKKDGCLRPFFLFFFLKVVMGTDSYARRRGKHSLKKL